MYTLSEYIKLGYLGHTQKQITEIQIIPFTIASKKYIEINSSKVLKDLCMKTFKRCMKEIFIRHKRKHISYLLTGRINTVNTSIIPKSIYIFTAVSFKIPRPFSQNRKKIFTTCIKMLMLLLFSCHVMSDSLWLQGLQDARLPCPLPYVHRSTVYNSQDTEAT